MPGLTRDRGCLYYVPWISILGMMLLGGGTGVWIYFVNLVYHSTSDGLGVLGVSAYNLDRPRTAMIATSIIYLFWIVIVFLLCFARSFIEAAHDATGLSGAGSTVWLVFNAIFAVGWWLIVLWLIVALMGCSIWAGLLYVIRGTIDTLTSKYGPQPNVTWLPSDNTPCPGQCLNLSLYAFIDSSLANSCICQYSQLYSARNDFDYAYRMAGAMIGGNWAMVLAGLIIMVNFACMYSHTKREKEYIKRLTYKQFVGL